MGLRIRGFVANFFGCDYCVQNFLEAYGNCQFDRCSLSPKDGRGHALWLSQVHNAATVRIAKEDSREPYTGTVWPPAYLCSSCWPRGTTPSAAKSLADWNTTEVYEYLKRTYASAEWGPTNEPIHQALSGFWISVLTFGLVTTASV